MITMAHSGGRVGREGAGPQDCPTPGNTVHKEQGDREPVESGNPVAPTRAVTTSVLSHYWKVYF